MILLSVRLVNEHHKSEPTFIISHRLHKHSIVTVYYVYEVYAVMTICIYAAVNGHLELTLLKGRQRLEMGRFKMPFDACINTRILADHPESLVVKTLSTSGLHIIEQNTLYFGLESPWNLRLLIF